MDNSPTLSIGGSRARAALLATTGTGTGNTDRRVVFLASQPNIGGHDTRTWPHHWSPHMTGNNLKSPEISPHLEHKLRTPRGQTDWCDDPGNSNSMSRQSGVVCETAGPSTRTSVRSNESSSCGGFRFGVYGWRKRCLYSLVLGLMVMVIMNLALTLWLLKVMDFSSKGIGSLRVVPGGVELRGQAAILDALVASSVRSRTGRNLMLESWSNFTASARSHDGRLLARFTLREDRLDCVSEGFKITDLQGKVLFSADSKHVVVGAKMLTVSGAEGAVFQGSVQTPVVRSGSGHDLSLESATRALTVKAPQRIVVESSAGEISASCLTDLKLQSVGGAIKFNAASVFLKGLQTPGSTHSTREQHFGNPAHHGQKETTVYQLCACANGKLFLAKPDGACHADDTTMCG